MLMAEIYECVNFQKTSNVSAVGLLFDVVMTASVFRLNQIVTIPIVVPVTVKV